MTAKKSAALGDVPTEKQCITQIEHAVEQMRLLLRKAVGKTPKGLHWLPCADSELAQHVGQYIEDLEACQLALKAAFFAAEKRGVDLKKYTKS